MNIEKQIAFSDAEFERRLRAVRESAARRGFDALLLFSPSNVYYLSGFFSVNLWDFQCLLVPLSGEPVLVIREFEKGRFQTSCRLHEPWTYPPDGSGPLAVAQAARHYGYHNQRLGLEVSRYLEAKSFETFKEQLPEAELLEATDVMNEARLVKSEEEIGCLRKAAKITGAGMCAALEAVKEGVTDSDIAAEAARALLASGSDFMCIDPIVAAAHNAGLPHSTVSGLRLKSGDPVFVELGACVWRYTAPLMRTAVVGHVSAQLRELADYSSRTLDALIAALKPGIPAYEAAKAAQCALAPIESRIFFHYVWGYSVGVGFPPSWLEETNFFIQTNNFRELQPGMVFHLPLMLRVLGHYGAGFSETVLITPTGAEVLTEVPRQLRVG
jgi:Xaa-Pro dipeptidase